jgi:hypothetical protein
MKNYSFLSVILIMLFFPGHIPDLMAQENVTPPLMIRQNAVPPVPPPAPGDVPPPPPGNQPLPPGPAGIPVVSTIPAQSLMAALPQAVATTEKLSKLLTAGRVWYNRAPGGEVEVKGAILYQGEVVAVLHFDPADGNVLPLGINPHVMQNNTGINTIKTNLSSAVARLKIVPAAEYMEPEACWSFPVTLGDVIVTHIKVYYDGVHVMEDYVANQEMSFYGQ